MSLQRCQSKDARSEQNSIYSRNLDGGIGRPRSRSRNSFSKNHNGTDSRTGVDLASIGLGRQRILLDDLSKIPKKFVRRIFGLNPFKTSYWTLYSPLDDFKSRLILGLGIVTSIAAGIPLPIIGLIFKNIINSFPPAENELVKSIGELLGVGAAYFVLTWTWSICWGMTGERISSRLRESLVKKAFGMDMAFFDIEAPNMTSILTSDTKIIQTGTSEKVGLFIQSISYFVAAFAVGFSLDAKLTGILFAAVVPSMAIVVIAGSTAVSKFSKRATKLTDKAGEIAEGAIKALSVVQAFGINEEVERNHRQIMDQAAKAGFRKSVSSAITLGSVYCICYAANALAFFLGSQSAQSGEAGTIYAVVFLILDASFVVGQFGPFLQTFALAAASGSNIFKLLDHQQPSIDVYSDEGLDCTTDTFNNNITFENVTFVYPVRAAVRVLEQVNLTFKPGKITGIVGMSGSGKSTIASLLLRFFDPSSGKISIGENDMKQFNVRQLRSRIALVDQDPVLFSGTIFENIKYGIPNSDDMAYEVVLEMCTEASKKAKAASFISSLPNGIHTEVGGTVLSGGQRQRLCLARALVGQPALLVLDEPTSALDTKSEKLILQALDEASRSGCTIVMIAHRLSTIQNADHIVVMENGQCIEQSTHSTLMEKQGAYRTLIEAQQIASLNEDLSDPTLKLSSEPDMEDLSLEKNGSSDEQVHSSGSVLASLPSTLNALRRCLKLSEPQRPFIFLGLGASLISGAIIIGESIIFGNLIYLIDSGKAIPQQQVDFFCLLFFIVSLIALVAYSTAGTAFGLVSESLIVRVRDISLHQILRQDHAWFLQPGNSAHDLMASLTTNASSLAGISGVILGTILSVTTSIISGIVLANIVAWKIAVVLLSAVPVMVLGGFLRLRLLAKSEERHETAYKEAAALASEACDAIRTVAALGLERSMYRKYRESLVEPYKQGFKFVILGNLTLAFSLAITYFVYALAYWWGAQQVRNGSYTMLDFFIVLPALLFSAQASGQMFSLAPEITRARSAAKEILALHDQIPSIMSDDNEKCISVRTQPEKKRQLESSNSTNSDLPHDASKGSRVEFQAVSLIYPTRRDRPVLQDITFVVEPGEFVGIVGPSGAGKSSVIALIERFYDVSTGSICFDGKDIRELNVQGHRARMSLVAQDPDLFGGSIHYNVSLGAGASPSHISHVTRSEVEEVCRACGLHDFIMSLPEGYQTECGANGSTLSGGQKQRVAIARALLRNPSLLLLDEATSALDSQNERDVQKSIASAARGRTTIMIAHRLSSVKDANKILVFDNGSIVEQGNHDELISKQGVYASMIHAQSTGI